ncbi:hypothetical protein [Microseira wollei]|uniref:DUF2281 domain-containing protein n=1 Tax=Microseira wollei NIES-4236 TaxID=2530354 RepID=A0AAV3XBP3_9CYAN|nr:hypothetical protein [Microseira wollei]GET37687.1 hypothetical protein MiSe_24410 [Microseira wollei NIES-4236]
MTIKEQLLQTIEQAPEPILKEALNYLHYLIEKYLDELEEQQDLEDLKLAREDLQNNRTISLEQLTSDIIQDDVAKAWSTDQKSEYQQLLVNKYRQQGLEL